MLSTSGRHFFLGSETGNVAVLEDVPQRQDPRTVVGEGDGVLEMRG
jgi:hypothetical protein